MAIDISADVVTAQSWGAQPWEKFDVYPHATRDPTGNPVIVYRHPGGGIGGYYNDVWTTNRAPAWFFKYLHTTTSLGLHFDVISVETAQRSIDTLATGRKTFVLGHANDFQRAVSALKQIGRIGFSGGTYKSDPRRYVGWGESHGANVEALSQVMPRIFAPPIWGEKSSFSTSDPALNAIVYHIGQPDVRDGVSLYSNMVGWQGTNLAAATQWNALPVALKQAMSLQWYVEQGNGVPLYIMYAVLGDHIKPYTNVHDSQQGTDLAAAMATARLTYALNIYSSESNWLDDTPTAVANYSALYTWLAAQIPAISTQNL